MNGLRALRAIRAREKDYGHIHLIALTGYNSEPDRVRLLREGFDSVIGKPFRLEALDERFRQMSGEPPADKVPDQMSVTAQNPVAKLLECVGGDAQLPRKMISTFFAGYAKARGRDQEGFAANGWRRLGLARPCLEGLSQHFRCAKGSGTL